MDGTWANSATGPGNWSDSTKWTGGTIADGVGAIGNFNLDYGTNNKVITIDNTSRTLGTLNIGDPGVTYRTITIQASGGASLIFDNGGAGALLSKATIPNTNNVNDVISAPVILADNLTINMSDTTGASNLTISGNISETGGARNITKTGNGTSVISAANTYTGTTTIVSGTLVANNAAAFGNTNSPVALGDATSISSDFSPTLLVNNPTTFTRDITVGASNATTAGTYRIGTGNATTASSINSTITLNQNLTVTSASGAFTLDGSVISGSTGTQTIIFNHTNALAAPTVIGGGTGTIALTKTGSGATTLTGANTYTGVTTISNGALIAANDSALGTTAGNTTTSTGGSLQLQGGVSIAENLVTTGQGNGTASNTLVDLNPTAPGTIRSISGANTLSGTISLTSGGGGTLVRVDAGSTLDLAGNIGILNGGSSRILFLGGIGNGNVGGVVSNNFGGSGVLSLEKVDAGTWTLSNASNAYTGTTTVSDGTLLIQGSLTGTTGNVNVNTGTLGGTGNIARILNVGNGTGTEDAIIAPGVSGIGTLTTTNAINFASDSVFALQINTDGTPSTDLLTTTGAISLGSGIATLNYEDLGSTALSSGVFTFLSGSSITGNFGGLPEGTLFSVGANQFEINYTPTNVQLTVVPIPEPGSIALLLGAAGTLVGIQRYRRRTA